MDFLESLKFRIFLSNLCELKEFPRIKVLLKLIQESEALSNPKILKITPGEVARMFRVLVARNFGRTNLLDTLGY